MDVAPLPKEASETGGVQDNSGFKGSRTQQTAQGTFLPFHLKVHI